MKLILLASIASLSLTLTASAQWTVFDPTNLEQAILQLLATRDQLRQTEQLLKQLGDPADVKQIAGAAETLAQLRPGGTGRLEVEVNVTLTGAGGLSYQGQGLYRAIEPDITLADGTTTARQAEDYQKFDALQQAVGKFSTVSADTKLRRDALRAALRQTTEGLTAATSDAEVQKLQGVLAAQQAELANLGAERAEAAAEVLVQQAANETDHARQDQAELELRVASVRSALRSATGFFQADSRPALIPNPSKFSR